MFYRTFSRFQFLLKSTNQHGVHSPFMYDFVTKGLYQKKTKNNFNVDENQLKSHTKKEHKIISKIVTYFKIHQLNYSFKDFEINQKKEYKILYTKNINTLNEVDFTNLTSKHIVLISNIYQSKETTENWQKIIYKNDGIVTVNLFYFGIIFFRKEQAKEHFNIRV